jgi:hypothetical protein
MIAHSITNPMSARPGGREYAPEPDDYRIWDNLTTADSIPWLPKM